VYMTASNDPDVWKAAIAAVVGANCENYKGAKNYKTVLPFPDNMRTLACYACSSTVRPGQLPSMQWTLSNSAHELDLQKFESLWEDLKGEKQCQNVGNFLYNMRTSAKCGVWETEEDLAELRRRNKSHKKPIWRVHYEALLSVGVRFKDVPVE